MSSLLKGALLALVLATLTTLIGSMAFSLLLYPGSWLARFLPLPAEAMNIVFWGLLFLAWITAATAHGRAR